MPKSYNSMAIGFNRPQPGYVPNPNYRGAQRGTKDSWVSPVVNEPAFIKKPKKTADPATPTAPTPPPSPTQPTPNLSINPTPTGFTGNGWQSWLDDPGPATPLAIQSQQTPTATTQSSASGGASTSGSSGQQFDKYGNPRVSIKELLKPLPEASAAPNKPRRRSPNPANPQLFNGADLRLIAQGVGLRGARSRARKNRSIAKGTNQLIIPRIMK